MNYHILHQFDEQWFEAGGQADEARPHRLFGSLHERARPEQSPSPMRHWLIVFASLLIAACALYFALDARRHTNDLQQRLSEFETKLKK
jgi:hypothetical protein